MCNYIHVHVPRKQRYVIKSSVFGISFKPDMFCTSSEEGLQNKYYVNTNKTVTLKYVHVRMSCLLAF